MKKILLLILLLNISFVSAGSSLLTPDECQTDFKMVYIYVYESENHIPMNLERLERQKELFENVYNRAGKSKITIDVSYPTFSLELNDSNRDQFLEYEQGNPLPFLNTQEIAKEFYRRNPDTFDLIVFFNNFETFFGRSPGHSTVISNIEGIGRELWDQSEFYGSESNLLGWIYEGDINHIYSEESLREFNENEINCMLASQQLHETVHQWAAYIGNQYRSNGSLPLQTGFERGAGHWFQGFDVGFDPVGGWEWINNGDGSFTTAEPTNYCAPKDPDVPERFAINEISDLTLYLIGALESHQIDPILWIDYNGVVEPNITISAHSEYISIEDIIAEEGERKCINKATIKEKEIEPTETPTELPDDVTIEKEDEVEDICKGCMVGERCYPFGNRQGGKFCSDDTKRFELQVNVGKCEDNFKCLSNLCIDGKCKKLGLWERFLNWLNRLFGKV